MNIRKYTSVSGTTAIVAIVDTRRCDSNVNRERRCVRKIAKTSVIRQHRQDRTIILKDRRLTKLGLLKLNLNLILIVDAGSALRDCGCCCCGVFLSLAH